ncbi:MAG: UMP kinase [Bacilli bacterium]|jgi:uridylate kinase
MYRRVLLKLSGEALKEKTGMQIIDVVSLDKIAKSIQSIHDKNIEICVVIGAGNIWRGKLAKDIGIEDVSADYMGMLGTVINAVALSSSLKKHGVSSRVLSAIPAIDGVTEAYSIEKANSAMKNGEVVFLAGGTGKPFFTTDTAATLRAIELNCDAILMGKFGVDGVYTSDPTCDSKAKFLPVITYKQMLEMKLQIMDLSAVELIKDKDIEIRVFSMSNPNNFRRVIEGRDIGTVCKKGE